MRICADVEIFIANRVCLSLYLLHLADNELPFGHYHYHPVRLSLLAFLLRRTESVQCSFIVADWRAEVYFFQNEDWNENKERGERETGGIIGGVSLGPSLNKSRWQPSRAEDGCS